MKRLTVIIELQENENVTWKGNNFSEINRVIMKGKIKMNLDLLINSIIHDTIINTVSQIIKSMGLPLF